MKSCIGCSEEKPLEEFYAHPQMADGRVNRCKACVTAKHHENMEDPEWRESERARSREKFLRGQAEGKPWAKPKRTPVAHYAVSNAIRDGRLIPLEWCEKCGHDFSDFRREGHHFDYEKPLEVTWLCAQCHHQLHAA